MNIGVIAESDFFDIGVIIKKTYENVFNGDFIKFITLTDDNKIDVLILDNISSEEILSCYFKKLHSKSIVISNVDNKKLINRVAKENFELITFGFNPKATITISSFIIGNKDTATFCIQRDFSTIKENYFFEQEFIINSSNISEFDLLLAVSTLIILDLSIKDIQLCFLDHL